MSRTMSLPRRIRWRLFGTFGYRLLSLARWVTRGELIDEEFDDYDGTGWQEFSRGPFTLEVSILQSGDAPSRLTVFGREIHPEVWL